MNLNCKKSLKKVVIPSQIEFDTKGPYFDEKNPQMSQKVCENNDAL